MKHGTKIIAKSTGTEYTLTETKKEKSGKTLKFTPSHKTVPTFTMSEDAFEAMKRRHVFEIID